MDHNWQKLGPWAVVVPALCAVMAQADTPGAAPPYSTEIVSEPAKVQGRVRFKGTLPRLNSLRVTTDLGTCGIGTKPNESLVVGSGGELANVVAHLEDVFSGKPASSLATPTVDQNACVFTPHVAIAMCRRPLFVANSDPVLHNVHAITVAGWYSLFNVGLPPGSPRCEVAVKIPGPVMLRCDAGHMWMRAYVYGVPNPYAAVTGTDGRFAIDGIPPGHRVLKLWHELLGTLSVPLDLPANGTVDIEVEGTVGDRPTLRLVTGVPPSPATPSAQKGPPR